MTFKNKSYACGTLQKVYEKGLRLALVMADGGYTATADKLQGLLGPIKTVAYRIEADYGSLGDGAIWFYGDDLRDAVWVARDWAITSQPKETQQPVWDAFVEFHDALQHAVFIADICELRHFWQHTA